MSSVIKKQGKSHVRAVNRGQCGRGEIPRIGQKESVRQAGGEGTCGQAETGEESTEEWEKTCKVKNRETMILSSAIGCSTLCSICEQFW